MDDLLREMRLLIEWQCDRVRYDVVYEGGTHRAQVTDIIDLDRRWTAGKDPRPRILGVTGQVDGDIDAKLAEAARRRGIGQRAEFMEFAAGPGDAIAHAIAAWR